jgi:hypothetical protein
MEVLYLVCGARRPQLKRGPLGSAMTEFEALLTSALTLRIPPSEAIRGLSAFAVTDFESNPAYVHYRKSVREDVEMQPRHVRAALTEYLEGRFTAKQLRDWCLFITLTAHFNAPQAPPDDEDWYDNLWDTVNDLASPEVFGEITPEVVRAKLGTLNRYGDDR